MFDIGDVLSKGWDDFKNNAGTLIAVTVIVFLVSFGTSVVFQVITRGVADSEGMVIGVSVMSVVVNIAVNTLLQLGTIGIFLKVVRGQEASIGDLFAHFDKIVPGFIASLLISIGVAVGMILLIVPGIIVAIMTAFSLWFIADRHLGAVEAIKASAEATKGQRMNLFLFGLAAIGISLLGILACCVGLLVTVPVLGCAGARIYLALTEGRGIGQQALAEVG